MAGKFRLFPQGETPDWSITFQILGTFNGLTKWARLLNATGLTDDTNFFFRLRNRGSGGKHQRWERSTDGATVATMTDDGLSLSLGTFNHLPVGLVLPYAGSAAPSKYLLCDGSAVSRTTYALLFAAIGITFGNGDGSTTFNVPDLRGRMVIGVSGSFALGSTGGATTVDLSHVHDGGDLQLPHEHDHDHDLLDHDHTAGTYSTIADVVEASSNVTNDLRTVSPEEADASGKDHQHTVPALDVAGESGSAHFVTGGADFNQTENDNSGVSDWDDPTGTTGSAGSAAQSILNPYAALTPIIYAGV